MAGFKPEQVSVTVNQNMLIVSGTANEKQEEDKGEYLYRGIAGRSASASGRQVRWDEIMDALRILDEAEKSEKPVPHYKQVLARKRVGLIRRSRFRSPRSDEGRTLN